MNCNVEYQIATHVNADAAVDIKEQINEMATFDLFQNGQADFSNGEIELYETVDKAFEDEYQLASALVERIARDDLSAITELKLLLRGMAEQKNLEMAERH